MTYKVNGTDFSLQPTTGRWLPREQIGTNGAGNPIYPGVREFEITWQLVSPSQFNQIVLWFQSVGTTGTAVVSLPQFGASSYTFYDYTGCVIQEPESGVYFTENQMEAYLIVSNIRA